MKKLISVLLAFAMLLQMGIAVSAEETVYSETGYSFKTLASISDIGRTFGAATYSVGDNQFVCLGQQYGIQVYNITDMNNITLVQDAQYKRTNGSAIFTNDASFPMEVHNGYLYFANNASTNTYILPILEDGSIDLPVKADGDAYTVDTAAPSYNRSNTRAIYGMAFLDDNMITLENLSSGSNWISENLLAYDVSAHNMNAVTKFATKGRAYAVNAIKKADGQYRICYISSDAATNGEGNSIFNIVDFDPVNKVFDEKYSGIIDSELWPDTPGNFRNAQPQFLSETKVALSWGKDQKSSWELPRIVLTVDFADLEAISVRKIDETPNSSDDVYNAWTSMYDGRLISWNSGVKMFDDACEGYETVMSLTKPRVCDVKMYGDIAVLAADTTVQFIQIDKKTLTEEALPETTLDLDIGEPITATLDATKVTAIAAANVGGKKMVYLKDTSSGMASIYAYDATNPQQVTLVNTYNYDTANSIYGTTLNVRDGYLIVSNNSALEFFKINEDGSLPESCAYKLNVSGNAVKKVEFVDNLMFANTNGSVLRVYNAENLSTQPALEAELCASGARGFTVERLSNMRYRVSIIQRDTFTKEDGTTTAATAKFYIYDLLNGLKGLKGENSIVKRFEGTPDLSEVNVWPGKGIFGEDDTVQGYLGFSTTDTGELYTAGKNTVRYSVDAVTQNPDLIAEDDIIIDTSNPEAPKVVSHIAKTKQEWTPRQYQLDRTKILEQNQYGPNAYVMQYTDPTAPETLYTIENFNGTAMCVLGNMAYAADGSTLKIVKLTEEPEESDVIVVRDSAGADLTAVKKDDITSFVTINNAVEKTVTMVTALYDKETNTLQYLQVKSDTFSGKKNITDTLLAEHIDDTKDLYLKVFVWEDFNNAYPLVDAKVVR